MKKILCFISIFVLVLIIFSVAVSFASEYQAPLSMYKDNYFIAGDKEDQTKFQISVKGDIIYPRHTGIFFGYTQTTWWTIYDGRDTMSANYQPEVFYRIDSKKNIFNNYDLKAIDFIQVSPFNHCSTGVEGANHRSINIYYGQVQMSTGGRVSAGINLKVFGYYTKDEQNEDINKYKSYYENDLFLKLNSATVEDLTLAELHFKHGGTLSKGWLMVEAQSILFSSRFQPRLFVQYFYGYGENIVNYNIKEHSVYGGLIF